MKLRVCMFLRRALLACLLLASAALAMAQEATVLVAGGAGYRRPIEEVAKGFEATGAARVERVYGHMGQVLAQAHASDKVAVIFGEQELFAKDAGLNLARLISLGRGRLVLAWPKGRAFTTLADLAAEDVKRIGMPDMKMAVFGKAARESLEQGGLFARLEPRLIVVPTVPQVSAWLQSGEVDAGFINLTEALAIRERIGGYIEVPQSAYKPVNIAACVLAGRDSPALAAFVEYLQGPAAQEIFKRYGL